MLAVSLNSSDALWLRDNILVGAGEGLDPDARWVKAILRNTRILLGAYHSWFTMALWPYNKCMISGDRLWCGPPSGDFSDRLKFGWINVPESRVLADEPRWHSATPAGRMSLPILPWAPDTCWADTVHSFCHSQFGGSTTCICLLFKIHIYHKLYALKCLMLLIQKNIWVFGCSWNDR